MKNPVLTYAKLFSLVCFLNSAHAQGTPLDEELDFYYSQKQKETILRISDADIDQKYPNANNYAVKCINGKEYTAIVKRGDKPSTGFNDWVFVTSAKRSGIKLKAAGSICTD